MATLLFFPLGFLLFYYKMVRETNKRKQNGRALMIAGGFGLLCVLAYVILALYGGAWNTRLPAIGLQRLSTIIRHFSWKKMRQIPQAAKTFICVISSGA